MTIQKTRTTLLSLLAVSAVAMATPALAQNYGYRDDGGRGIEQRQNQLEQRVVRLAENGRISRNEYRLFQRQFARLDQAQYAYQRNGLSGGERAELNNQLNRIQAQIRYERAESRDDRGYSNSRYDRNHRYDRYDRDD